MDKANFSTKNASELGQSDENCCKIQGEAISGEGVEKEGSDVGI